MFSTMLETLFPKRQETQFISRVNKFCAERGQIVGSWAAIESCIDQVNFAAWLLSERLISKQVPLAFTKKVDVFKKAHRDVPLLIPLTPNARDLLGRLLPLVSDRHFLVHGYVSPFGSQYKDWTLCRHEFSEEGVSVVQRTYSDEQLTEISRELIRITKLATEYVNLVVAKLRENHPEGIR